jgi:hypothetical protein
VLCAAAERPQLRHLVLICSGINFIDASALETLTSLVTCLHDAGIQLYLTDVKGPVMDRLARTEFLEQLGHERVFLSTQAAYEKLASASPSPMPKLVSDFHRRHQRGQNPFEGDPSHDPGRSRHDRKTGAVRLSEEQDQHVHGQTGQSNYREWVSGQSN